MNLDAARAVADAVLVEGYVLYPYRASALKNRYRWTFGVLAPRSWAETGGGEPWWLETQLLVEAAAGARLVGQLRCFQIERRRIEARGDDGRFVEVDSIEHDGEIVPAWDEGVLRELDLAIDLDGERDDVVPVILPGDASVDPRGADARVVRDRHAVEGAIVLHVEPLDAPLVRVTIRVENTTPWREPGARRDRAIVAAMASTHLLLGVTGGRFVSAIDPPPAARAAAAACAQRGAFPVLAGPPGTADVMLVSPFAMQDHPMIAPESAGDLCDATEIDELLALRTATLTDAEKREARATDPRARAIVDRVDGLPPAWMARVHGAARDVRPDGEMAPRLAAGGRVRLRPRARGTDVQDLLLAGRTATIAEVRRDVDGTTFLAVTIDDDPAAELHHAFGRFHYFRPDEVEPL